MPPTLVCDLDGTLVDTAPDLAAAVNRRLKVHALAPLTDAEIVPMIGDGVRKLLERAFAARGHAFDEADLAVYLDDYGANFAVASRAYPGVAETLAGFAAAGWRLAVCTNKPEAPSRALLAALGIADCFAAIGGGDSFPTRKPDPAHLRATLAAAGGVAERAVMVGDHRNDIVAAAGLGMPAIYCTWGYGNPSMAKGAAAVAERFSDLPALAARLVGRSG
jgi:phosphoglycolate phosphatase